MRRLGARLAGLIFTLGAVLSALVAVPAAHSATLDLPISSPVPAVIIGQVVGADTGQGVSGICIMVTSSRPTGQFEKSTALSTVGGLFIDVVPAGAIGLLATDCRTNPVYAPRGVGVRDWPPAGGLYNPVLRLQPASTIEGHVTDASTHQPISGMCMAEYPSDPGAVPVSTFTGADGSYKLFPVSPGTSTIRLNACGGPSSFHYPYSTEATVTTAPHQTLVKDFALPPIS